MQPDEEWDAIVAARTKPTIKLAEASQPLTPINEQARMRMECDQQYAMFKRSMRINPPAFTHEKHTIGEFAHNAKRETGYMNPKIVPDVHIKVRHME